MERDHRRERLELEFDLREAELRVERAKSMLAAYDDALASIIPPGDVAADLEPEQPAPPVLDTILPPAPAGEMVANESEATRDQSEVPADNLPFWARPAEEQA